jgi:hypothetical protein
MPAREQLVLCGGLAGVRHGGGVPLKLALHGQSANVRLQIEDISRRLLTQIPDAELDLLEVATYIYAADSAAGRGGPTDAGLGRNWRRRLRFVIPVRQPGLWSSAQVNSALVDTLSFLSDDEYAFEFHPLETPPALESYFEFSDDDTATFSPDAVILFSGGLDSLAGAVQTLVAGEERVALVSHRSASKIFGVQRHLIERLQRDFGRDRVRHVPVWANVMGGLTHETTHRTRSFLFAALGTVTARLFRRDKVHFYENGVVSLNLPLAAQVVGARATRTTHPQALDGFRRIMKAVLGRDVGIDNRFAWMTKAEVVKTIADHGYGDLIRDTRSCTRVHDMTRLHTHCGHCSQCLDRRFAILAAGQGDADPAEAYKVDLFEDARPAGPDRELALAYVRSAATIERMGDVAFFGQYGETSRIVGYFSERADTVAGWIFDLHQRHAAAVGRVFNQAIRDYAEALRHGDLPEDSLIPLVVGRHAGSTYDAGRDRPREPASPRQGWIRLAIDEETCRVVFDGWGKLTGVSAGLITALAEPFRGAVRNELAPEHYPFVETHNLMRCVGCDSKETFRRRVLRCRNAITRLADNADVVPPSTDAVIENNQWHGYRLNPDNVRLVAIAEITTSD